MRVEPGAKANWRIEALINPLAGRAGPGAEEEMLALFAEARLTVKITVAEGDEISAALDAIKARRPDLLVVLAGDGTARAAAHMCGPHGPMLAPLAGGTMNMLPHAIYGDIDWRQALEQTLRAGVERPVGGGQIAGHTFYVAGIFGSAALFASAREAARRRRLSEAFAKARRAWRRAVVSHLGFRLDGSGADRAQAMILICPLISRNLGDEDNCLEAAAIMPASPTESLRVGARVALSWLIGDWRDDPVVTARKARSGVIWSRTRIPALLDGESVTLGRKVRFRFRPHAFRAFAPPPELTA